MAILVSAHQLRKSFAARPLFDGLTFAIESGERVGLIGPNGAGKSTLLRILAGQQTADDGKLSMQRGLRVGYMEQVPTFAEGATVMATILEGTPDPYDWENMSRGHELFSKLGLDSPEIGGEDTPVAKLSGGWRKRVALARELARQPDLLLLDEPTNHLDVESIVWLEEFIENAPFAVLMISHDRLFLQNTMNRIIELDRRNPGGMMSVNGDYATYLEIKEQTMAAQERREIVLKNTLRRETEWLRRGAKARTTKQQARINRAGDLKETVEDLSSRNQTRTARIDFQSTDRAPNRLLEAKKIGKAYGDRRIFWDLDFLMTPGTRLGLLGPNGCGKTTLIRTLLGREQPDEGIVVRSDNLSVAYFEQNREALDPQLSLAKTLCPRGDHVDFRGGRVHIRSYLDRFLFTSGQMDMAVGKLSGGEQSRLLVARLMLQPANLLVLDEPTNDLDLATLVVLEEVLQDFDGAVILVSHDRYFLDNVCNKLLAFNPGAPKGQEILPFADLAQWETWKKQPRPAATAAPAKKPVAAPTPAPAPKAAAPARKLSFKDQRELDGMEAAIHAAEAELEALTAKLGQPEVAGDPRKLRETSAAMNEAQAKVDRLYARWSELGG